LPLISCILSVLHPNAILYRASSASSRPALLIRYFSPIAQDDCLQFRIRMYWAMLCTFKRTHMFSEILAALPIHQCGFAWSFCLLFACNSLAACRHCRPLESVQEIPYEAVASKCHDIILYRLYKSIASPIASVRTRQPISYSK